MLSIRADYVLATASSPRGDVADETINDEGAQLMRTLNLKIRDDQRVSAVMLTLGDGLTVVRKL